MPNVDKPNKFDLVCHEFLAEAPLISKTLRVGLKVSCRWAMSAPHDFRF